MAQELEAVENRTETHTLPEPCGVGPESAERSWCLPDGLCERCRQLELSTSAPARRPEIDFGSLDDLAEHGDMSCPFCRLVLMAHTRSVWNVGDTIIVKWDDDRGFYFSNDGERLVYVRSHADADATWSPHQVGRVIPPQVDPELVRSWLATCEDRHGRSAGSNCAPRAGILQSADVPAGLKHLRLIDVERQCLVAATAVDEGRCPRYVTLSYLWGGAKAVLLNCETFQAFSRERGLAAAAVVLPRTIADAMALVARIGERYLWVDSLCIIQDDDEDKADSIMKMDLIYQGSVLNIVAAAGIDSNAGLPGLWPGERDTMQHVEEVLPNVFMTHVSCLFSILSDAKYMTRGWTFQEFILSPRNLIFLENCVYFLCGSGVWSEDTLYDAYPDTRNGNTGRSQNVIRLTTCDSDAWGTFILLLFRYTGRQLSFKADFLNAMAGILNRFCVDTGADHLAGLPLKYFDLALLHWSYQGSRERLGQFPSWSWVGWFGYTTAFAPQWDGTPSDEWLAEHTYIVWYVRDGDKKPRKVFEEVTDSFSREGHRRLEYAKKNEREDTKEHGDEDRRGRNKASDYGRRPPPVPPCVRPDTYNPADYPTEPTMLFSSGSSAILQFWAQTIVLSLEHPRDFDTLKTDFTAVHGDHCEHCGSVRLDSELEARNADKRTVDAVILSSAARSSAGGYPCSPASSVLPNRPFYWVMTIEWEGNLAARKGLGFVFQDCIAAAKPDDVFWREIALV
ncbi:Heterokaryon incompatibility protein-domain-containing protein [Madurella fahalii]|uniref:Heterokaryon incompatibility protein-domain-containing protein n=1 Tax=Madurella fahalii TaxID=1157608 RepID=A0ABQ0GCU6_9PEZI